MRLVRPTTLLAAAMAFGCDQASETAPTPVVVATPAPSGERPNFLVLAPDTLRGDRVGATRNGSPVMPNVDALAARGVTFTHVYSQSGWTLPALASLLSGRYPLVGTQQGGNPAGYLRADLATIPEQFAAAGYDTAVFWGAGISDAAPEFSRGFAHVGRDVGSDYAQAVLAWLDTRTGAADKPFFALVHNVDLQFPLAPAPGDALLATAHPAADRGMDPVLAALSATAGRDAAAASLVAAYDATVTRYDAAIGRMVAGLAPRGVADDTVVIVTSNHGIELGERGSFFHGTVSDTNLHVPLVVMDPAARGPGRRIDTLVQTVDLAPTLLLRAGLTTGPELVGQSLLPLFRDPPAGNGAAYVERDVFSFNSASLVSLRTRTHKLVRMNDLRGGGGVRTQLFDLAADPSERTELRDPAAGTETLAPRLEAWLAERVAETAGTPAADNPKLKQALQEEGYWGVATGQEQGTGGKKPGTGGKKPGTGGKEPGTGGKMGPPDQGGIPGQPPPGAPPKR
ncbi:MAG: sulfatase [Myxococcota bacterium]